jgi:hypothetical protein
MQVELELDPSFSPSPKGHLKVSPKSVPESRIIPYFSLTVPPWSYSYSTLQHKCVGRQELSLERHKEICWLWGYRVGQGVGESDFTPYRDKESTVFPHETVDSRVAIHHP